MYFVCILPPDFKLKNLRKEPTCFMSDNRSVHKTQGFVTGISNFYTLVVAC